MAMVCCMSVQWCVVCAMVCCVCNGVLCVQWCVVCAMV
jgi:hypothetical protein